MDFPKFCVSTHTLSLLPQVLTYNRHLTMLPARAYQFKAFLASMQEKPLCYLT